MASSKLNASQIKMLRSVLQKLAEPLIMLDKSCLPLFDNTDNNSIQLNRLLAILRTHDWLFLQALTAYAELDDELMTAQETIAELEEALNECNGVQQINERERIRLTIDINISQGRKDESDE